MDYRSVATSSFDPPVADAVSGEADKCLPACGEYNVQCLNKFGALLIGLGKNDSIQFP
ncbi:MAG: hypothetical protein GY868_09960 [Deltaproteobacteria bacterium]|nr:hypothetical protein [Deltaproteobacteria bacterium]